MASPDVLDVARLVAPISDESPVGTDLRHDSSPTSVYYQVKDARSQARNLERAAEMSGDTDSPPADWRPVLRVAPDVLADKSKDLEIAAYLIEALARTNGFAGLRDGFRVARGLVEQYGDDLFPLPDEDGLETRVAPLTGLNGEDVDGTLVHPILNIPLTQPSSSEPLAAAQYQQARELERATPEARERRMAQGAASLQQFDTAVAETSREFFANLLDDIDACRAEFDGLNAALDDKYGEFAPPSSNLRGALEKCRETLLAIARDKLPADEPDAEENSDDAAQGAGEGATVQQSVQDAGAIRSREDAFRILSKVSEYFRKAEPHTPISYALDQVVRWGRLPLPELLKELISDESTVSQMFRLVGIRTEEDESE